MSRLVREGEDFDFHQHHLWGGHQEGHVKEMVDPTNIRTADSIHQCLLRYPL
jgi:hypothetical protein